MAHPTVLEHDSITCDIKPPDKVVLYPTFGRMDPHGRFWQVIIRGVVFEPGPDNFRRRLILRLLRRVLRVESHLLESPTFKERVRGFLVVTTRGKQIAVRIGPSVTALKRGTRGNGHFHGVLRVGASEIIQQPDLEIRDGWLDYELALPSDYGRRPRGRAQLIDTAGISVITDIDDTIKHSHVNRRRALLSNTFLKPFQPVPGMAELYQQWASQGAVFHYISSTPWQLYEPIQEFCQVAGFPDGSFHLRSIRLRDPSFVKLFVARRRGKSKVIRSVFRAFPRRKFLLVGDSGEKDPEIYGAMARRYPNQIVKIIIRDLPICPLSPDRAEKALRGVPRSKWIAFDKAEDLSGKVQF